MPSLNEVVSLIKAEEGRRIVMFDVPNIEGMILIT
jgi:hypothetical protein